MVLQSFAGLIAFLFIAWVLSEGRRHFPLKMVLTGLALQLGLALLILKVPVFEELFLQLNHVVLAIQESTQAGTSFVFGYLGGAELPFEEIEPSRSYIFALRALPLVLFLSALSSLFFHWRLLPLVVEGFSRVLRRSLGLGGAEGVGVASNVFLGMVESPLFIRPYLKKLTRSELFTVMSCGMATIAGTVMVLYAGILADVVPNALGHILTASLLNAPAAVIIAKIMVPETKEPTAGRMVDPESARNSMEALTRGTLQGVQFLINIIAMLVVLVAIVHLVNLILGLLPDWGGTPLTLQRILGLLMIPIVWLIGIPWNEAAVAGQLMATKTVINELVAFVDMSTVPEEALSGRSFLLLTYAMCGFANPGSLGIMIGGLTTMAPERRDDILTLGFRTIVAGTLATCLTAAWIGILAA